MVQVLVHPARPLGRREMSEERMRMPGALLFPALVEFAYAIFQSCLLPRKIARVADHEHLVGRIAL